MHNRSITPLLVPILALTLALISGCVSSSGSSNQSRSVTTAHRLAADVETLVYDYPGRSAWDRQTLNNAGLWIVKRFQAMGYEVTLEPVPNADGSEGFNVIAQLTGTTHPDEIIVIGAHYDAEVKTPGADDNASGVAVMLELAARFASTPQPRTIRWIGFTNEEGTSSRGAKMGSRISAENSKHRGENIIAMLSLEMLGYYSDEPNSQTYPFPREMGAQLGMTLPTVGDFIGIVARTHDTPLVTQLAQSMSLAGAIPVVAAPLPPQVQAIYRSDHANYWMQGYPAAMITDTSEYRTPHYHKMSDTPETLDFDRMAVVADALDQAVRSLGN